MSTGTPAILPWVTRKYFKFEMSASAAARSNFPAVGPCNANAAVCSEMSSMFTSRPSAILLKPAQETRIGCRPAIVVLAQSRDRSVVDDLPVGIAPAAINHLIDSDFRDVAADHAVHKLGRIASGNSIFEQRRGYRSAQTNCEWRCTRARDASRTRPPCNSLTIPDNSGSSHNAIVRSWKTVPTGTKILPNAVQSIDDSFEHRQSNGEISFTVVRRFASLNESLRKTSVRTRCSSKRIPSSSRIFFSRSMCGFIPELFSEWCSTIDVIVIGGGHNGLVNAALSREGGQKGSRA